MIERDFNYINGNTAVQPKREIERKVERREKERRLEDYKRKKLKKEKIKKAKNLKIFFSVVQMAVLAFTLGSIIITRDSKVYSLKSTMKSINKDIKEMTEENEAMKIDLLKNSSLRNVEKNAKSKTKMIEAKEAKKVEVDLSKNYLGDLINNK